VGRENLSGANTFARAGSVVEPYIHSRRVPIVRFVQDVEIAVTIEICKPAFVKFIADN